MTGAETPNMITSKTSLRVRASLVVAGLASLLGGCVIEAKIGDDPDAGGDTGGSPESAEESSTTEWPDTSAGPGPDAASATSSGPGSASVTSTSADDTTSGPGVDPETALALCEVSVVPPQPGDPVYYEGIMCADGCQLEIVTSVYVDLFVEYGECLCDAMGCGPLSGGSSTGDVPPGRETDGETGGDPDGCGPFPGGDSGFTCTCEMCSIAVTNVDGAWVETEADLEGICECMCGGAGCGSPV
jgi:hypothetical protein